MKRPGELLASKLEMAIKGNGRRGRGIGEGRAVVRCDVLLTEHGEGDGVQVWRSARFGDLT